VGLIANTRGSDHARLLGWLETFGRCSMLDVFMVVLTIVAVEVSIISDVTTHAGLYVFTAAVVLSMAVIRRLVVLARRASSNPDKPSSA
jgi:paraquat-inducible protein A